MLSKAPRGTRDILPKEVYKWQYVEKKFREICALYGYEEMRTPIFEHTEVFTRSVGDTTDIVQKEMYTFTDKGDRQISLKPEGTAGTIRAFIESKLYADTQPTKLFYITPCFRYERPQAGRQRQFHQFGIEALGSDQPSIDAEVISLAVQFFNELGLKDLSVNINSVGCPHCREEYNKKLKEYLREMDIKFVVDKTIVRGLDYYRKTAFEIISNDIGSQSTVCGGGRYDGLVEQLGGPKGISGIGFGLGAERLLLTLENNNIEIENPKSTDIYIATIGDAAKTKSFGLIKSLRDNHISTDIDHLGKSLKAQFKYSDKINAKYTIVIGDDELAGDSATLKNMSTSEQTTVKISELVDELKKRL